MAVNRYDTPAEADFINTYVPIPFEQLFTLGKQQKADVDKAIEDFGKAKKLWSEFQSESLKDMQTWDAETMGRVRPVINDMAKNLDLIKTAEGRMRLQSAINSVDTGLLGRLKQSAKNFELRKAAIQKLILDGKYNPYWHDLDMTGWDSTKQGVFNDINVTPYQSVNDLVHPYVNDLKPDDMGSKNGYLFHGVSKDKTRAQVDAHLSEILATPQAQMHMKTMMNMGLSQEQAMNEFVKQAYTAAEEKAWKDRSGVDQFVLLNARLAAAAKENTPVEQSRVRELRGGLDIKREVLLAKEMREARAKGLLSDNPTEEEIANIYSNIYNKALNSNDPSKMQELMNSQSIPFSEGEFKLMLNPNFPNERDVDIRKKGEPAGKNNRIMLTDFTHVVPMNDSGIPVAEVSKEFLLNNEKNLLDNFNILDGSLSTRKSKVKDLIDSYGNIVNDLVSNLTTGYMRTSGRLQDYAIVGNNSFAQMPLATGKVLVSESEIDAILESNKGKYGDLSTGDIKKILFEKGINGKHKIGEKLKDRPYTGDTQMDEDYYELNIGYPIINDEAQMKSFEDAYAAKIFGGSASFDAEQSHAANAFDSRMRGGYKQSNM